MPGLALPFGVVGAAAGWLSIAFLSNPIVALTLPNKRLGGVVVSAIVAAIVGLYLGRRCAPGAVALDKGEVEVPDWAGGSIRSRLITAVALGGAAAGALIGALAAPSDDRIAYGLATGALDGFVAALAFAPLCSVVLSAARRSVRARHGSIVAGVDARAVPGVLAGALGVMTLLALPDWPAARAGGDARPFVSLAILCGCIGVVAAVFAADVLALRRLRAWLARASGMEALDEDAADIGARGDAIDLGVGDGVRGEIARGDAYRGRARTRAVVRGDTREALAAVRRATRRGAAVIAALVAVVAIDARASGADVELAFDDELCQRGDGASCRAAALVASLDRSDDALAETFDGRGCDKNDAASCVAAAEHAAARHESAIAYERHNEACTLGHRPSCDAADALGLKPGLRGGPRQLGAFCGGSDMGHCLHRHLVETPPADEGVLRAARRCIDGQNMECDAVGTALTNTDPPGAVLARIRACEFGLAYNCYLAGMLLKDGAIPSARELAPILLERSCRAEPGFPCCEAAYSYAFGRDAPIDFDRARDLYQQAAGRGFESAGACGVLSRSAVLR